MSVYDIRPSRASSERIRRSSFSMWAIVPGFGCALTQNYAFGHGFVVLSRILWRPRFISWSRRYAGQCTAWLARFHQPAAEHLLTVASGMLLGQRLAAHLARGSDSVVQGSSGRQV